MANLGFDVWVVVLVFTTVFGLFLNGSYKEYLKSGDWSLFLFTALIGIGCVIVAILLCRWPKTKRLKTLINFASSHAEHFKVCTVGMSCDDFSLIAIAGPNSHQLPPKVRQRMAAHESVCAYHQSKGWHQSALSTLVTDAMEHAAGKTIIKHNR